MPPTNGRPGNDQGDPIISPRATDNKDAWDQMIKYRGRKENSTALAADALRDGDKDALKTHELETEKYAEQEERALCALFEKNRGVAYWGAKRQVNKWNKSAAFGHADLEDFQAIAQMTLWQQIQTWDPHRGTLTTWATNPIKQAVLDAINELLFPHLTQHRFQRNRPRAVSARKYLRALYPGREPSYAEIAAETATTELDPLTVDVVQLVLESGSDPEKLDDEIAKPETHGGLAAALTLQSLENLSLLPNDGGLAEWGFWTIGGALEPALLGLTDEQREEQLDALAARVPCAPTFLVTRQDNFLAAASRLINSERTVTVDLEAEPEDVARQLKEQLTH
jgi:hypothetical protein